MFVFQIKLDLFSLGWLHCYTMYHFLKQEKPRHLLEMVL